MSKTRANYTGRSFEWLTLVGTLRDGFIVTATGLYVLGYAVWSYDAWKKNLGPLPALEFQYFVAGVVPALIIALFYFAVKGIRLLRKHLPVWLGPDVTGMRLLLRRAIFFVVVVSSCLFFFASSQSWFENAFPKLASPIASVSGVILVISLFFLPPVQILRQSDKASERTPAEGLVDLGLGGGGHHKGISKTSPRGFVRGAVDILREIFEVALLWLFVFRFLGTVYVVFLVLLFSVLGFFFFTEEVYPKIPQEFGGVRARCAYLDIANKQLSNETLREILVPQGIMSNSRVVRSVKVAVFFSGSNFLLVTPYEQRQEPSPTVYEIRKDIVQAITWCPERKVIGIKAPAFAELPGGLQKVLIVSGYSQQRYDQIGDLQKAALLNIHSKMKATIFSNEISCFDYVRKIVEIRPDRIFALADEKMLDEVSKSADFSRLSDASHKPPARLRFAGSYRTRDRYGSLHVTFFQDEHGSYYVDIDIDTASGLLHAGEVLQRWATASFTHPYEIYEILTERQEIDPGYQWLFSP